MLHQLLVAALAEGNLILLDFGVFSNVVSPSDFNAALSTVFHGTGRSLRHVRRFYSKPVGEGASAIILALDSP